MKKSLLSMGLVALVMVVGASRSFGDYWQHDNRGYYDPHHHYHHWSHNHGHRGYYDENHVWITVPL